MSIIELFAAHNQLADQTQTVCDKIDAWFNDQADNYTCMLVDLLNQALEQTRVGYTNQLNNLSLDADKIEHNLRYIFDLVDESASTVHTGREWKFYDWHAAPESVELLFCSVDDSEDSGIWCVDLPVKLTSLLLDTTEQSWITDYVAWRASEIQNSIDTLIKTHATALVREEAQWQTLYELVSTLGYEIVRDQSTLLLQPKSVAPC